jgi:hypothetical protein
MGGLAYDLIIMLVLGGRIDDDLGRLVAAIENEAALGLQIIAPQSVRAAEANFLAGCKHQFQRPMGQFFFGQGCDCFQNGDQAGFIISSQNGFAVRLKATVL